MRIAIDLTPLYDHLTGIERYNLNISQKMIEQHPESEYILIFKNKVHDSFRDIVQQSNVEYKVIPSCNKLLFIQYRLLKVMNSINADYYLFLSFTSPIFFNKNKIINAIHDLTCWDCPDSISRKMEWYYRITYHEAVKKSWKIVTVSKFSQNRICEKYKLSQEKIPIIYDGLTEIFKEKTHTIQDLQKKYKIPQKYILSLSTLEPRKNLQLLLRAYAELLKEGENLPDLVLAGRKGWKLEEIFGNISENVKSKVHFTGFVDDIDLPQLYKQAELFVFPSKYEGFGLPIIEAMSQKTMVLSSNAASLPEVVQNAGILFESDNVRDLKSKILYTINLSSAEREKLLNKGRKKSYQFNWKDEANKLYAIMQSGQ